MRQGYEIRRIKEICKKGSSNVAQKDLKDCDGEYPIYGASGFIKKVNFFHQENECIGLVKDGAGVGRVLFLPPQSSVIGTLQYIKPNDGYNIRYVGYCLQSINLSKYSQGATIPHIYFKDYGEEQVVVTADMLEQQRIVDILDTEFAKIDALKENAEKNLQNAKDLFQAVLRKELEPKEGWNVSTLKELLKLTSGDNLTAKSIITGDYPVYGGNGIMGYHNRYNLDGLNVLVGRVGALCGNVRLIEGKIWYTDNCFLVHDKTGAFHLPYLAYALQNANLRQYATQAAQPVVSNASMKDVQLSIPPTVKEQCKIVDVLNKIKENSEVLQHKYDKTIILCNDLKQALLRKAFNGEL